MSTIGEADTAPKAGADLNLGAPVSTAKGPAEVARAKAGALGLVLGVIAFTVLGDGKKDFRPEDLGLGQNTASFAAAPKDGRLTTLRKMASA